MSRKQPAPQPFKPSHPDYRVSETRVGKLNGMPVFEIDAEKIARLLAHYRIMGVK